MGGEFRLSYGMTATSVSITKMLKLTSASTFTGDQPSLWWVRRPAAIRRLHPQQLDHCSHHRPEADVASLKAGEPLPSPSLFRKLPQISLRRTCPFRRQPPTSPVRTSYSATSRQQQTAQPTVSFLLDLESSPIQAVPPTPWLDANNSVNLSVDTASPTISVAINDGGDALNFEDSSVTISGTTSGAEDDQTVSLNISPQVMVPINTTASVSSNSYSVTGLDLSSLSDGTLTITADVDDLAGNSATQATDSTTKDTGPHHFCCHQRRR